MKELLPNFIIAGSAKCGTTSLHGYLSQHPDVFMPAKKEIYYFSRPWYGEGVPQTREEYLAYFADGEGKKNIGEATADYFFDLHAAQRIWEMLADKVKIIITLRNPVNMMYSMWEHSYRERWDTRSPEEALLSSSLEDPRDEKAWQVHWCTLYLAQGQYDVSLQRYLNFFPKDNIKVLLFEEFFRPGLPLWGDLCRFLDIDPGFKPASLWENKGIGVRLRPVVQFFHNYYPRYIYPFLRSLVPHGARKKMKAGIIKMAKWEDARRSAPVRRELERRLHGSVRRLETLLDRDLSEVWF